MTMEEPKEPLCGFINVLKPPGMTSAQVVGFVRRLLGGEKIGHAGTLDPEASGVLPLMVGKAARLFDYMQDKEKAYVAEIAFGSATDTQDAQGTAIAVGDSYPTERQIQDAIPSFTGTIQQRPPMFSAIKKDGQRLYDLARKGIEADIPTREVTVNQLDYQGMTQEHGALLHVRCSKGFYVRTLCHDLGESLGCPAHMRFLLRIQSGVFTLDTAYTLEQLKAAADAGRLEDVILEPSIALPHLPSCNVPKALYKPLRNGGRLPWERFPDLHGTKAADGAPFCLWMDSKLVAIGERAGDVIKVRSWIGQ